MLDRIDSAEKLKLSKEARAFYTYASQDRFRILQIILEIHQTHKEYEKKGGYSKHPETLRWVGKQKALYLRHEALIEEFNRRGYNHQTPLDKKFATGSGNQSVFINTANEQKVILSEKPCECLLH